MLAGQIGAHGQICTDTGDALDVVPLLIGLHEQKHLRPVSITGLIPASGSLSSDARSEVKMVGVPGNAPGPGTDLVRFRL